jgi:hypothetical protein
MVPLDAYSPDYRTARSRFREMVARRSWPAEAHVVHAPGFDEGDLTIDVARAGPADAERLIILSSGIHGVEAPLGSAVQLAWIDSLPPAWEPPPGCAVLLLHALNPYGFAMGRRANEDNIDLNRNFLAPDDFARFKEKTAADYARLDWYLHPPVSPSRFNWAWSVFLQMRVLLGWHTLHKILPAGQYAYPKGIFYGGEQRGQSTEILTTQMPRWVGSAKLVVHLDFHSGLGKYGDYRLLLSEREGSEPEKFAKRLFGANVVEYGQKIEGGYENYGDFGDWVSRTFADRLYVYLCAEFGTYNSVHIIGALRWENQAHFWEKPDTPLFERIKRVLKEAFVPQSPAWRWSVVHKSLGLLRSALRSCAS